ncbi:MAG: paraslipin [Leptolyngbya sp. LCM1.Bin17]|nr:MAG: paraslipin [Leptolyngbya sp. LCM1.Bin17]
MPSIFGVVILVVMGYTIGSIRIINQGTEALVERLGRYHRKLKPGLNFIVPFLDVIVLRDSVREQLLEIYPCSATTRDQVNVSIDVIIFWRVLELELAYYAIEDVEKAINEVVVIALRSEINKLELDLVLPSLDFLDRMLLSYLDEATEPWGIKVTRVEVREIMPSTPTRKVYGHSNLIDIG